MKKTGVLGLLPVLIWVLSSFNSAKIHYNTSGGYMADGYDVVAYFSKKAVSGKSAYTSVYDGVKYKFSSKANQARFKTNPRKYVPQYGGWCAYAMGSKGSKVDIDGETFEIRNGKLYLFYNSWGNNTYKSWTKEGQQRLRKEADINWTKVKYKRKSR